MDRVLGSTPELVFAFWLAVTVSVLAVVMLLVILAMRYQVLQRERHQARVAAFWYEALTEESTKRLPRLAARDLAGFLEAWNGIHEARLGRSTPRLALIARQAGMCGLALAQLRRGFHDRATAIDGLGYLRDPATFDKLAPLLRDRSPIVSLCAARALMQIDPSRAMAMFVPQILEREDWTQGSVARILVETGTDEIARQLSGAVLRASEDMAPRLVRFLAAFNPAEARQVIRTVLVSPCDDHLVSTCLQVIDDRGDLDLVRARLDHPRWHVRMQAAATLGRLGAAADAEPLSRLLSDAQWWVRYRAAQALQALPGFGRDGLRLVQQRHADHYARDIIEHVLAERRPGLAA